MQKLYFGKNTNCSPYPLGETYCHATKKTVLFLQDLCGVSVDPI